MCRNHDLLEYTILIVVKWAVTFGCFNSIMSDVAILSVDELLKLHNFINMVIVDLVIIVVVVVVCCFYTRSELQ